MLGLSNLSTIRGTLFRRTYEVRHGLRSQEKRGKNRLPQRTVDFLPTTNLPRPIWAELVDLRHLGDTPKRAKRQDEPRGPRCPGGSMPGTLAKEIGAVLRLARRARGRTLRDVSILSSGVFKSSSLASYERGERAISLERFLVLADLYGIPPARMMAQISRRSRDELRSSSTYDRTPIGGVEGAVLAGFVHEVVALRRQPAPDEISLRDSDLEVLATASGRRAEQFMEAVEPALAGHDQGGHVPLTNATVSRKPSTRCVQGRHPSTSFASATSSALLRRSPGLAGPYRRPGEARDLRKHLVQAVHGGLDRGTDIEEMFVSLFRRECEGVGDVIDEHVVPRLMAVAEDRRSFPSSMPAERIAITPASPCGS